MRAADFYPTSAQLDAIERPRRTETIKLSGGTTVYCNCTNCQMVVEDGDYRCVVCHDIGCASDAHGKPDELRCARCSRCEVCALPADEQPDVCPFVVEVQR